MLLIYVLYMACYVVTKGYKYILCYSCFDFVSI